MPIDPLPIPTSPRVIAPAGGTYPVPASEEPVIFRLDVPRSLLGYNFVFAVASDERNNLGVYGPNPKGRLYGPENARGRSPKFAGVQATRHDATWNLKAGTYYVVLRRADANVGPRGDLTLAVTRRRWQTGLL